MLDFVADFRDATRMILKVNKALDVENVADDAAAVILSRIRKRFLNQTSPEGEKWPVSQSALRRKSKGIGGGTLYKSGDLFRSIQAVKRGKGLRGIQTDVPYALQHHNGENGQVKRRFLDTNDDDMEFVTQLILARINK